MRTLILSSSNCAINYIFCAYIASSIYKNYLDEIGVNISFNRIGVISYKFFFHSFPISNGKLVQSKAKFSISFQ